tara:strand:+ start:2668 stop:2874 length:207 start_codon:yes stop_codon:yes gene_type:complete
MTNSNFLQNTRTYASVSNLEKALDKYNLTQFAPIIVGIPETDRVTAIFQFVKVEHTYIAICNKGFAVI